MKIKLLLLILLVLPQLALADWSTTTKVQRINIGANGQHGTVVILEGYVATGTGCTVPDGLWFDGSNPNYEAFLSTL